ncbi:MAG: right-handed parallel beta-helix repeat-containing protein, partial [Gemmatimonadota bacterium]
CTDGVDNDCDGYADCDDGDCLVDGDDDGYYAEPCGGDCDDGDRLVNPEATEECHDGVDNDCDGYVDSEDCAVVTQSYCESVNDVDEGSMMFPKFDPAQGDLVGVDLSIVGTLRQDVMIENVDFRNPTNDFWLDTFFSLQFSIPGCPSDPLELEIGTHLSEICLAAYDGVTNYDGESGVTFEDLLVCSTATCEVAEYAPYIGTGDVSVAFSGEFSRHESGYEGGQPQWNQRNSFDAQVCVRYSYERPLDADVPSARFPTIQNALERVPDGGVVGIRPGRYDESLCIEGKLVHLVGKVGDGELAPEIVGTDMDAGVITVLSGGGVSVKDLHVSGGAYGIAGAPDDTTGEALPASVQLENVSIYQTSRGIYGNFSYLEGRDVEISNTEWNGMSILYAQLIHLMGFNIHDTGGVGILLFNVDEEASGYLHVIGGKYIYGNSGGGIVVAGGAKPVLILGCIIDANGDAGIDIIDTGDLVIQNTQVLNTYPRPDTSWGDGIRIWSSEIVTLMNSTISGNARAGISIFGCDPDHHSKMRHWDNILSSHAFDWEAGAFNTQGESCPPGSYEIEHLGGTWCLDENGNPQECQVLSSGPPASPEPLP